MDATIRMRYDTFNGRIGYGLSSDQSTGRCYPQTLSTNGYIVLEVYGNNVCYIFAGVETNQNGDVWFNFMSTSGTNQSLPVGVDITFNNYSIHLQPHQNYVAGTNLWSLIRQASATEFIDNVNVEMTVLS